MGKHQTHEIRERHMNIAKDKLCDISEIKTANRSITSPPAKLGAVRIKRTANKLIQNNRARVHQRAYSSHMGHVGQRYVRNAM